MIGREAFERSLESALANLAAPAETQIRYLSEIGLPPLADELALQFDDVIGRVNEAVQEEVLSRRTAMSLEGLDALLAGFSGEVNESLWTTDALRSSPQWVAVRRAAQEALSHVRDDLRSPPPPQPRRIALEALKATIWVAILTLGTAYSFSRLGVVERAEFWAVAVVHGAWGYCVYRATRSLISRLDRLPFSRRALVYLALVALMLTAAVVFGSLARLLGADV